MVVGESAPYSYPSAAPVATEIKIRRSIGSDPSRKFVDEMVGQARETTITVSRKGALMLPGRFSAHSHC
jgi:hypothetical protein